MNPLEPLKDKLSSFGFSIKEINGNNVQELDETFKDTPFSKDQPNLVLANTCKGKGVSFIENVVKWHHKVPTEKEYKLALEELNDQHQLLINE